MLRALGNLPAACALAVALVACERRPAAYSQATPDALIASARSMVQARQTLRLQELIYAEDDLERAFLVRVGKLLGHLHELTLEVQAKFPKEMDKLRADAEAAAKDAARKGQATGAGALVNQLIAAGRQQTREQREDVAQNLIKNLFSDPYGWLSDQSGRLTSELISDDQAALLWDGKPILPPVGLALRKVDDKWFVVPPLNLPFISKYRPRTKPEWNMWASVVKLFDNAIIELRDEVKAGQVAGFSDVSRKAGEKIFMPAAIAFIAISKHYEKKFRAPTPTATTPLAPAKK